MRADLGPSVTAPTCRRHPAGGLSGLGEAPRVPDLFGVDAHLPQVGTRIPGKARDLADFGDPAGAFAERARSRDVAIEDITTELQQRIHRVTCSGEAEVLDGAREAFESLAYPRYYLDFETIGPAVPFWAGTRPYQAIPIQWSCHIEERGGDIRHEEFLDLSGEPPMRALAESLIDLGRSRKAYRSLTRALKLTEDDTQRQRLEMRLRELDGS